MKNGRGLEGALSDQEKEKNTRGELDEQRQTLEKIQTFAKKGCSAARSRTSIVKKTCCSIFTVRFPAESSVHRTLTRIVDAKSLNLAYHGWASREER